jgi:hypothetical protein
MIEDETDGHGGGASRIGYVFGLFNREGRKF